MAKDGTTEINGRVTTAQFYEALIKNKDEMSEMERRLTDLITTNDTSIKVAIGKLETKVDDHCKATDQIVEQVKKNTDDIGDARLESRRWDGIIATIQVIIAGILTFLGLKN